MAALVFIHISGLAPLCENMVNGRANKPGDVVRAKNGKTIQVMLGLLKHFSKSLLKHYSNIFQFLVHN